jgi:hypothetical protein
MAGRTQAGADAMGSASDGSTDLPQQSRRQSPNEKRYDQNNMAVHTCAATEAGIRAVADVGVDACSGDDAKVHAAIPPFNVGEEVTVVGCGLCELKTGPLPLYTEATLLEAMATAGREQRRGMAHGYGCDPVAGAVEHGSGTGMRSDAGGSDNSDEGGGCHGAVGDPDGQDAAVGSGCRKTGDGPCHGNSGTAGGLEAHNQPAYSVSVHASRGGSDVGLGTPSTRASVIETLIARDYIEHVSEDAASALIPTERGLHLWEAVRMMMIANIGMAVHRERQLAMIESGEITPEAFHGEIVGLVRRMTAEILRMELPPAAIGYQCPKCSVGRVSIRPRSVRCNNPDCSLAIARTILGHTLTVRQLEQLILSRSTGLIDGFTSAKGRKFSAAIVLDEKFGLRFEYPERGKRGKPQIR